MPRAAASVVSRREATAQRAIAPSCNPFWAHRWAFQGRSLAGKHRLGCRLAIRRRFLQAPISRHLRARACHLLLPALSKHHRSALSKHRSALYKPLPLALCKPPPYLMHCRTTVLRWRRPCLYPFPTAYRHHRYPLYRRVWLIRTRGARLLRLDMRAAMRLRWERKRFSPRHLPPPRLPRRQRWRAPPLPQSRRSCSRSG